MENVKVRIKQVVFCSIVSISMLIIGGAGYALLTVNAQEPPVEGCRGCLGNYECGPYGKCVTGCCPTDCSAYSRHCE